MVVRSGPGQGSVVIVAISPPHQGRGLGRALLASTLAPAWEVGIRTADLTVTEQNRPAVALYRRSSFAPKRRTTAYVWEAT
jgi:ribosomal protein S18 acetylase RimI-like enzyme